MSKERRLGRGLEALLGRTMAEPGQAKQTHLSLHVPEGDGAEAAQNVAGQTPAAPAGQFKLPVNKIERNPYQPRREFDPAEIASLAASLREHGVIQPLLVRKVGEQFQLIAGERRLRAAMEAGLTEVPVTVREADDRQLAELAIVENLQRKDLNPLEKAASFDQYLKQYGCTQEELAKRLGIDRSTIANLIRLLELPAAVQQAITSGAISQGHARALLPLGDEAEQVAFCQRIQSEGLSVRATEELVQEAIHTQDEPAATTGGVVTPPPRKSKSRNQQYSSLEQEFRLALGAKVSIKETARGRGKIVIQFSTAEEFDRLRAHLTAPGALSQAG